MALHLAYPCTCMRTHFSSPPATRASDHFVCGAAQRIAAVGVDPCLSCWLVDGWVGDGYLCVWMWMWM